MKKLIVFAGDMTALVAAMTPAMAEQNIYANDGTFLGNTNNQYDPNSIYNPYGQYGSQYSQQSMNNPYGNYGSSYSSTSPKNPYATPGTIVGPSSSKPYGGSPYQRY